MINVIGLGYIGLPTALMLAAHGEIVVGTDYNREVVEKLQNGTVDSEEYGIKELYDQAKVNIEFSTEYQQTSMYIVAVPTPYNKESKKIDAQYVISAVNSIMKVCNNDAVIVIESTISPGTIDKFIRPIINSKNKVCGFKIQIAHAPERIIPGKIIEELKNNSRTIGADDKEVGELVKAKYKSFCQGEIVVTNIKVAEMTKVVENTYRDVNIAFANELSKICHKAGINVHEVINIANMHPRVSILQPGPGVGGHCIAVDPWFLVGDYPQLAKLVYEARTINDSMPEYVLERLAAIVEEHGINDISRVGLYGLTYKENVSDIRESPTLQLLEIMKKHLSIGVKVYDPYCQKQVVDNQMFDFEEFVASIDALVVMVAHDEIKKSFKKIKNKIILDTRNIFDGENVYKL